MPRTRLAIALAAVVLAAGLALGQGGPPLTPETYPARAQRGQPVPRVVERVPVASVPPLAYALGGAAFDAGRVEGAHVFADPPAAERARRLGYGRSRAPSGVRFKQSVDAQVRSAADLRGLTILQIGDSHTAIDQFSGELRRRLQAIYGDGGAGYFAAGKPNIGVRAAPLKISTTAGWTYQSLHAAPDGNGFMLSGFNALAHAPAEIMTFSAEAPIAFDRIEIEALREPGGGAIDIRLDGVLESQFALAAAKIEPVIIRLVADRSVDRLRELSIATRGEGTVKIASVAFYNTHSGITYNAVGYPGATIDILHKLDAKTFADELTRLSPQIVVLAFGTNEGFNDGLDLERYVQSYERVVQKIRATLPAAAIVVVSPPNANRLPATCKAGAQKAACRKAGAEPASPKNGNGACAWQTPPQLDRVREAQRAIAERHRLAWWNWASMMPDACGAHEWALMTPPLIARDHVHFTPDGYRKSAGEFLRTLLPLIEKLRAPRDVVSHD